MECAITDCPRPGVELARLPVGYPGGITASADKRSNAHCIEVSYTFRSVP
jgi:hypothetical protein